MIRVVKILLSVWICMIISVAWSAEEDEFFVPAEEKVSADFVSIEDEWPGPAYLIGPGDVLDISVWKNKDMSRVVTVLPDGKISFPLLGEITAAGKSAAQLKKELKKKLSPRYILDPVLTLEVRQINSMLIYVIGRVNQPGRFVLNVNINVLQALAMAGGPNPFAKRNKIKIFREEHGETGIFYFRYDDVVDGRYLEQNIRLRRGDVIVVP